MFDAPSQTVQGCLAIYMFQSVQEWGNIFVVTNMQAEGNSSLYQLGNVLFNIYTHRILVDDDSRLIEVFMIVQRQPEHFTGTFIFMTMRHGGINIFSWANGGFFCDSVDLCIYHRRSADIAKLKINIFSWANGGFFCDSVDLCIYH